MNWGFEGKGEEPGVRNQKEAAKDGRSESLVPRSFLANKRPVGAGLSQG